MLARHSKHLVVVADSSKIGSVSKSPLCPIAEIHEIITDTGAMDEEIARFEAIGSKVHRAWRALKWRQATTSARSFILPQEKIFI